MIAASMIGEGSVVGGYTLQHQLGHGTMGIVYQASDPELGDPCQRHR